MDGKLKRRGLFESATVRLTIWYTAFVMALSLLFSLVLYGVATIEVNRVLAPRQPGEVRLFVTDDSDATTARQSRIEASTGRLVLSLVILNIAVLVGGSALSYFLAKRTLEPIEQAHEAQARFASDAAHELRTPLAVMQTEIEVNLRDTKTSAKKQKAVLQSSLEEVARLRTLTDRLLLLASQHELPIGLVDIETAVVEAVTHAVLLAQARSIAIDNQVGSMQVRGHLESIVNVLDILLDNAIKYSLEKTAVTVVAATKDKMVEISVSDQGPGIAPEEQAKIFERFYRADASRSKENVEGHGLGLSLAQRLASEMRGTLRVESVPDNGATFILALPKADIK